MQDLVGRLSSIPAILIFIAAWILFLRNKKYFYLLLSGISLAFPIYAGDPQISCELAMLAVVLTAVLGKKCMQEVFYLFLLAFTSIGFAAWQLFPSFELWLESARSTPISEITALRASLHPMRFLEFFYPLVFGNFYPKITYIGNQWMNAKGYYLFSFYGGASTLFLISMMFTVGIAKRRKKIVLLFTGLFITTLLLAFGSYSPIPLFSWFRKIIPFWQSFRYPERMGMWVILFACILQSIMFMRLSAFFYKYKISKKQLVYVLLLFLCSMAFALFLHLYYLTIVYGFVLLLFFLYKRRFIKKKIFMSLLLLVFFSELLFTSKSLIWELPSFIFDPHTYPFTMGPAQPGDRITRKGLEPLAPLARKKIFTELDGVSANIYLSWDALEAHVPIFWGLSVAGGFSPLMSERQYWMRNNMDLFQENTLDVLGAKYKTERKMNRAVTLIERKHALPYIWLPNQVQWVKDSNLQQIQNSIKNAEYQNGVALFSTDQEQSISRLVNTNGKVSGLKKTGNSIRFQINWDKQHDNARSLVLLESYNKNWKAFVNGREQKIFPVYRWAMGLYLPENTETIYDVFFEYNDNIIYWSSIITKFFLAFFLLLGIGTFFSSRYPI